MILLFVTLISNPVFAIDPPKGDFGKLTDSESTNKKNFQYSQNSLHSQSFEKDSQEISVLLTHVGEIDRRLGQYELDFWISVTSKNLDFTANPPQLDFVNGKIDYLQNEFIRDNYYEAFVQGTFYSEMDFHEFPFEKINMLIEIEPSAPLESNVLKFVVGPKSGIDSSVTVSGWNLTETSFDVIKHDYDENETFDRFVAVFTAEHSEIRMFLKTFFPVAVFLGISLISFWIPKNFTMRIYISMPPLMALTFWHIYMMSSIPSVGYLTLFDKVMIPVYALFVHNILSIGIEARLDHFQKLDLSMNVNKIMKLLIPILGFGVFFILLFV